ncbi:CDAN1-interacting nuclease 1-like isoform X1 [Dreissena polymorpha]|uniref:CDAN1-interacting nuclease 1 n=1 Tax=Dreissena polymorpha TaxID=45954 RepID=A0A9D4QYR8_DREPO|nr:CDAN1-interacting nuclease 1-like isoform X1 [Dreissena polymorpha]KAH3847757.1 hypothetical protein DPMN_090088 [Dreissena polymorpha]
MRLASYNEIVKMMHTYQSRDCLPIIAEKFPGVSLNALGSIFSQDYQKKMRKTHYLHYSPEASTGYYKRFAEALARGERNILIGMSHELDLSPALLGRIILERHLSVTKYEGETPPKTIVTSCMKEPSLIEDPRLAIEIHQCVLCDDHYGPLCDSIKHSIGHEYEFKLNHILDRLGLAYIGEDQMRTKGYDKTPDVKLEVPIAVDGHIVNWIESKASFGDEHSHQGYLKEQFWSYWNRFGPGMVIYWFGFIDELDVNQDKGIILRDHFPEHIVKMDPSVK